MLRWVLLLTAFLMFPLQSISQNWEIGGMLGGSNYIGDLSHHNLYLHETNVAGGMIIRYNFTPSLSLKGNIYAGRISGDDENAATSEYRTRNLHFRSFLLDMGIQGEYYLTGTGNSLPNYNVAPYIMGGISLFRFNPEAELDGEWKELHPLGTEGQETTLHPNREKYSLTQISVPLGAGVKHSIDKHWHIGVEAGFRFTFTDYLDDVSTTYVQGEEDQQFRRQAGEAAARLSNRTGESRDESDQRGDATRNDHYIFAGITLTYVLFPAECYSF